MGTNLKWVYKKDGGKFWDLIYATYKEEVFHCEGGKTLEYLVQIGGGCPMPGNIHSQTGLVYLKMILLIAAELDWRTFRAPFQTKALYDFNRKSNEWSGVELTAEKTLA